MNYYFVKKIRKIFLQTNQLLACHLLISRSFKGEQTPNEPFYILRENSIYFQTLEIKHVSNSDISCLRFASYIPITQG